MKQTTPKTYVYDLETYPNFFLAVFKEVSETRDHPYIRFTWSDLERLREFLAQDRLRLAGYNNRDFDDKILAAILEGHVKCENEIAEFATSIIDRNQNEEIWRPKKGTVTWLSIDLMQILGGRKVGSLKVHEVRLRLANVVDLPIEPATMLSEGQKVQITSYCENDVDATLALYFDVLPKIEVREAINERYPHLNGSALTRSDASIAEAVMREQLVLRAGFGVKRRALFKPDRLAKPASFTFDPAEHIDRDIRFANEANQQVLDQLRAYPPFNPIDWRSRVAKHFKFQVGNHTLELGSGGLHTPTAPTCVRSSAILDFDVASYYPNLLMKIDRAPAGLPDRWIDIVRELTNSRLAAKKEGRKSEAEVYKIIVNSLYGKLADKYSINLDLSLQLQVVLNGQLFLIMLLERFVNAGLDVISANTDGLYVDAGDKEELAQQIARDWEAATGFDLESKSATIYATTSINDYALFEPSKGWFYKRGRFGPGKRTQPVVIANAALEHISSGRDIEAIVRGAKDIRDFLFSHTSKAGKVKFAGKNLQKTNRWFRGTDGAPIEVHCHDGALKPRKVPDSENAVIANSLSTMKVPSNLDIQFYIAESLALAARILEAPGEPIRARKNIVDKARAARERFGFVVVPKGRHGQEKASVRDTFMQETIDYWRNVPLEEADWGLFEGFGSYTGREFGVIAIDVDDPEKARKSGIFDVLGEQALAVWHGKASASDIRTGKHRGTLIFRCDAASVRTTDGRFLRDNGFEILYGSKVVQLAGFHTSREQYRFAGKLEPIPPELLRRLEWRIAEPGPSSSPEVDEGDVTSLLAQFQALANDDATYQGVSGRLELHADEKLGVHLKGICVGHHQHSDKTNTQEMIVSARAGRLNVMCFHQSCAVVRRRWQSSIEQHLASPSGQRAKFQPVIADERGRTVVEALKDSARAKLILAPTGTGKTHGIVNFIAPLLDPASGNEDKFAIICASKDQIEQIAERFGEALGTNNITQFGIAMIEAREAMIVGEARSRRAIRENDGTRVAITHFTYVSRRGFSKYYYAFLKFIDENTHVIVDEVDAFVQSQVFHRSLGNRYRLSHRQGHTKYDMVTKCGVFHGFSNCLNCMMEKYVGYKISIDRFGNHILEPVTEFMSGEKRPKLNHIDIEPLVVERAVAGPAEIALLQQSDFEGDLTFDDPRSEEDQPAVEYGDVMRDYLQCAYLPTAHRARITYDGEEMTANQVRETYKSGDRTLTFPPDERRRLQFPSRACNVVTITGIDRRPLRHMSLAKSFVGLSATLTVLQERFLGDVLGDIRRFSIEPNTERRIDKIVVIGMATRIPIDRLADGRWKFPGRLLRFRETMSKAEEEFEILERSEIPVKFGVRTRRFWGNDERGRDHKVLVTYSFGSLGRGVDLPYDIVDVNASVYKPSCAYPASGSDSLTDQIQSDRMSTIAQNIGRVLRRSESEQRQVRVVVVEELENERELRSLASVVEQMSIEPVDAWWVPPFLVTDEICEWLTAICESNALPGDVPKDASTLLARAARLVEEGCSKKELVHKLRWTTVRKRIDPAEALRLEKEMERLMEARPSEIRKARLASPEKATARRDRRRRKICQLLRKGYPAGKIRSDMKVTDWSSEEQHWFANVLAEETEVVRASVRSEPSVVVMKGSE